jgi:phage FluMu protein Com
MKVVCAWCGKVLQEGSEPISHGICPECKEEMKQEMIAEGGNHGQN